jgi:hypothetical protein
MTGIVLPFALGSCCYRMQNSTSDLVFGLIWKPWRRYKEEKFVEIAASHKKFDSVDDCYDQIEQRFNDRDA